MAGGWSGNELGSLRYRDWHARRLRLNASVSRVVIWRDSHRSNDIYCGPIGTTAGGLDSVLSASAAGDKNRPDDSVAKRIEP